MNEFNELLNRWAELEPARCKKAVLVGECFQIAIDGFDWWSLARCPDAMDFSPLQRSLQEAIAARKWWMRLEYNPDISPPKPYIANISFEESDDSFEALEEEPAIALLSAYIQALEASQKIGGGSK